MRKSKAKSGLTDEEYNLLCLFDTDEFSREMKRLRIGMWAWYGVAVICGIIGTLVVVLEVMGR